MNDQQNPANILSPATPLPELHHVGQLERERLADIGGIALAPESHHLYVSPEQQDTVSSQTAMIEGYFASASNTLAAQESSESSVWDKVFELQCISLTEASDDKTKNDVALSILVGNELATYGLREGEAKSLLTDRLWKLAQTRNGQRILDVANANVGLCVTTGKPDKPFNSVTEQLGTFDDLLKVTDHNYAGRTALDTEIVKTADREQAEWLLNIAMDAGDMVSVGANLIDLKPEFRSDVARNLLANGASIHYTLLRTDGEYRDLLPRDEVIDHALAHNPGALSYQKLDQETPERRDEIVSKAIEVMDVSDLQTFLGWTGKENLDPSLVTRLVQKMGKDCTSSCLKAFEAFPEGSLDEMIKAGVQDWNIQDHIAKFTDSDQRRMLKLAEQEEGIWRMIIMQQPKGFHVISRSELLSLARERKQLSTVASSLKEWTDGSDQELILELMNKTDGYSYSRAVAIASPQLPALDKAWFLDELQTREMTAEIVFAMPTLGEMVDHRKFLQECMQKGGLENLGYTISNFDQIPRDEMYSILLENGHLGILAQNALFFSDNNETHRTIAEMYEQLMQTEGGPEAIIKSLTFFAEQDITPLFEKILTTESSHYADTDQYILLAIHFEKFVTAGIPVENILPYLTQEQTGLQHLIYSYDKVPELQAAISKDNLIEIAFTSGLLGALTSNMNLLSETQQQKVIDTCIERGDLSFTYHVNELKIDKRALAERLLELNYDVAVSLKALEFFGEDLGGLSFDDFIAINGAAITVRYQHRFEDYSEERAVAQMVEQKKGIMRPYLKYLNGPVSQEATMMFAKNGYGKDILDNREKFGELTPDMVVAALEVDDLYSVNLYKLANGKLEWLDNGIRLLGEDAPPAVLYASQFVHESSDQPIPQEQLVLGVVSKGQQGYEQLRALPGKIRQQLLTQGDDSEQIQSLATLLSENRYAAGVAKQVVRFGEAEWGKHGTDEWQRIMTDHLSSRAEHAPMPDTFLTSENITIHQIDAKEFDPSKIDEDARNRFSALDADIRAALVIAKASDDEGLAATRYDAVLAQGRELLSGERDRLGDIRANLIAQDNNKAIVNIDSQLHNLNVVLDSSPQDFGMLVRREFQTLGNLKIKGLDSVIRTVAFARAFTKSSEARELAQAVTSDEISFDNLASMDNLVAHVINNEVYQDFFETDHARKSFMNLTSTAALRTQLTKLQKAEATGKTTIQFVPSRGLLLELSGHMADACWASQYPSIAESFPNISSVSFLRDAGTNQERFVGSCLLIDTRDEQTGEKVLVVRGLNPIENYIHKVKIDEFTDALFGYVKSIAGDRRVAAVFDNEPGRAATNRPLLHEYLKNTYRQNHVSGSPLQLPQDTTFNSYVLSQEKGEPVYVVS